MPEPTSSPKKEPTCKRCRQVLPDGAFVVGVGADLYHYPCFKNFIREKEVKMALDATEKASPGRYVGQERGDSAMGGALTPGQMHSAQIAEQRAAELEKRLADQRDHERVRGRRDHPEPSNSGLQSNPALIKHLQALDELTSLLSDALEGLSRFNIRIQGTRADSGRNNTVDTVKPSEPCLMEEIDMRVGTLFRLNALLHDEVTALTRVG